MNLSLDVRFRGMARSEALEADVREALTNLATEFLHRHHAHVQVWLVSELNRSARSRPEFKVEIEVRYPINHRIFVSKRDADVRQALQRATGTLGQILNESSKRSDRRQARRLKHFERVSA
jgi:ribosome-associated translation inhibitor RaiA